MKEIIITYWICSVIFESLYIVLQWKKMKQKFKEEKYRNVREMIHYTIKTDTFKAFSSKLKDPFLIFAGLVLYMFICPIIAPSSLFSTIKSMVGYKTEKEKKAEQEQKMWERQNKRAEEWMQNEGIVINENPIKEE